MQYIFLQPANTRFKWELQVAITSLRDNDVLMSDIHLVFIREKADVPKFFEDNYGCHTYVYADNRDDKSYIPSIRPYLWAEFLKHNPELQKETFTYLDSDTLIRKLPDMTGFDLKPDLWYGTDTTSYLGNEYIRHCGGDKLLKQMADVIGVTVESIESIQGNVLGAQWIMCQPTIAYWEKVYKDSNKLWHFFERVEPEYIKWGKETYGDDFSPIQSWTSDMFSMSWNCMYFNIGQKSTKELDFCWATDSVTDFDKFNIYHNAGVIDGHQGLFYKGYYINESPLGQDFSWVDNTKASYRYVLYFKKV